MDLAKRISRAEARVRRSPAAFIRAHAKKTALAERAEELVRVWPTGAPTLAMAQHMGLSCSQFTKIVWLARKSGVSLAPRRRLKVTPEGTAAWKARLDALKTEAD